MDPLRPRSSRVFRFISLLLLAPFIAATARAASFSASPSGSSSGTGSITSPWNLATALAQPAAVHPGDTIWLRGGRYVGTFTAHLNGTATAPIKVRQYP